jgi:hypothetical protein
MIFSSVCFCPFPLLHGGNCSCQSNEAKRTGQGQMIWYLSSPRVACHVQGWSLHPQQFAQLCKHLAFQIH